MIEVDARGLACPIPVVRVKQAIDKNPGVEIAVLVNDQVSKENVSRLAESQNYSVNLEKIEDDFRLLLKPK